MNDIAVMMRVMAHINVGATLALLVWIAGSIHSNSNAHACQHACGGPSMMAAGGAAR